MVNTFIVRHLIRVGPSPGPPFSFGPSIFDQRSFEAIPWSKARSTSNRKEFMNDTPTPHSDMPASDLPQERVIRETGLAARVASIIEPAIEGLGYRLVRVKITAQNGTTVQVMAERPDGSFTIEDCEAVSKDISPVLDVDDPVKSAYHLEVSSPGIDRSLVRAIDFVRAVGHEAKIELSRPIDTGTGVGRRRYRGTLVGADASNVDIRIDQEGGAVTVSLPYDAMDEARLVMSDALIEAAQRAQAEAEIQSGSNDNDSDAGSGA